MSEPEVVEKKTTISQQPGQTTNVNVRPDGGADVQVNDNPPSTGAVVEETTTTTRRTV